MLCQVGRCLEYCIRHGRELVIDTERTETFAEPFARYFSIRHRRAAVCEDVEGFLRFVREQGLVLYPESARLEYGNNPPAAPEGMNYQLNGEKVTFDFQRAHEAPVLVHHQFGGGAAKAVLMRSLRLRPGICAEIRRRREQLPGAYVGIHIRDTDLRTGTKGVEAALRRFGGPFFLATDSAVTQRRLEALRPGEVFTSGIPDHGGRPLHLERVSPEEKARINETASVDLMLVALAVKVYTGEGHSGYANLARRLNRGQHLAIRWLAEAGPGFGWRLRLRWLGNLWLRGVRHRVAPV
jgi:hypothetical protein